MADLPPYPDTGGGTGRESTTSTPRWVKVFGIIVIVLVLVFVIMHLTGNGFGGLHGHTPPSSAIVSVLENCVQHL